MQYMVFFSDVPSAIRKYRVHLFVFFLALFIGLTLAHPAVFLNDEFITTNQLRQLHAGHQIIINEGKYGLGENGNMSGYFGYKGNILAYTLFLPMISMPAYWIIDITGEQFAYLILVLWTITALLLLLFINHFFRKYSYIGRWQWTPAMAVIMFLLFFINLYYYSPFSIDPVNNYPEILSIVFTNIILLSLSAIIIYEINRSIFDNPSFAFFGTMICLFSSSYFLWSTFCKDHILVFACFVPIVFSLVRFIKTDEYWYLPLAFLFCGLIAWARAELAPWIFLLVCCICCYTLIRYRCQNRSGYSLLLISISPLFTVIGALPFFLNNLLITKNMLLPVGSLYLHEPGSSSMAINSSQSLMPATGITSLQSVITMFLPGIPTSPLVTITDLYGILFYPKTGTISIFSLVPLFLVMIIIAGILLVYNKIQFSDEENKFIGLFALMSFAVFLAYASTLHILNTDHGITPDIRYLSPVYLPMTMIGLILLRKTNLLPENLEDCIKRLFLVCGTGLVFSIAFLPYIYAPRHPKVLMQFPPLENFFTLYILLIIMIATGTIVYYQIKKRKSMACEFLIYLICVLPFFWQVNATLALRSFSGFAGHIFWIPVMRVFWDVISAILISRFYVP